MKSNEKPSNNLVLHVTHEISLPVPVKDIPAVLETIEEERMAIKILLQATSVDGGEEIRIPLNYE